MLDCVLSEARERESRIVPDTAVVVTWGSTVCQPTNYTRRPVKAWEDFESLVGEQLKSRGKDGTCGWYYRGQRNASWPLKTTFERAFSTFESAIGDVEYNPPRTIKGRADVEKVLLREFQRRAHQYERHCPALNDLGGWLGLMQHYGGPTRLLDFTYSPYVAAFFALSQQPGPKEKSAVWAVNGSWCADRLEEMLKSDARRLNQLSRAQQRDEKGTLWRLLIDLNWVPAAIHVSPFALNERIAAQKGTFLALGNIRKSFIQNLEALDESRGELAQNVLRIEIPRERRWEYLEALHHMNIHNAALFPGLSGFASGLNYYHPRLTERVIPGRS